MCAEDKCLKVIILMLAAALSCTQLAGCASVRVDARTSSRAVPQTFTGGSVTTTQLQVSGGNVLGAIIVLGILVTDGVHYLRSGRDDVRASLMPAEPAVWRASDVAPVPRVNAQDCTQPIDTAAGNLRCR